MASCPVAEVQVPSPAGPLRVCLIVAQDAGGEFFVQLQGVDCDLEGEEPGLYYPTPRATA